MSLATRCPACGTTFRVVQDQLKVSEGWVRCGQCHEVFNALESLFELPSPAGPEPGAPPTSPAATPTAARRSGEPASIDLADPAPDGDTHSPPSPGPASGVATTSGPPAAEDPPAGPPLHATTAPPDALGTGMAPPAPPATPSHEDGPGARAEPRPDSPFDAPSDVASAAPLDVYGDPWSAEVPADAMAPGPEPNPAPEGAEDAPPGLEREPTGTVARAGGDEPARAGPAGPEPEPESESDLGPLSEYESSDTTRWAGPTPAWGATESWSARRRQRRKVGATRRGLAPAPPEAEAAGALAALSVGDGPVRAEPPAHAAAPGGAPKRRGRRRKPEFMRRVERAAQWQRPGVRALLASTAVVLGLLLTGQVLWQERDALQVHWPGAAQAVARACAPWSCRMEPPARLEPLVLEASQLQRTPWPNTLRLSLTLRNTAAHAVRTPAVELSFTDDQGQLLVRRVLLASAWNPPGPVALEPDGLWRVTQLIDVGSLAVSGYSTEVFYP